MYQIISDNKIIAICDKPEYIRIEHITNSFVPAKKENAQGVMLMGLPYNLPEHTEIVRDRDKMAPEAEIVKMDGGTIVFQQEKKISEIEETSTTGLLAVTDLYEELIEKGVV